MEKAIFTLLVYTTFFAFQGNAQDYNRIMTRAIKKSIGKDLRGYQTFSYPTDNYGVITSYKQTDQNFICDMWNCIGVADAAVPMDETAWMSLNGYAAKGQGGSITLTRSEKNQLVLNALLPKIYNVLNIGADLSKTRTTNIKLSIGNAYVREARIDPYTKYIISVTNTNDLLRNTYKSGELVLVTEDCVIDGLSVTVSVDQTIAADLNAKLGATTGGQIPSKLFSDGTLSVNVSSSSSGIYTFTVNHPVIFARKASSLKPIQQSSIATTTKFMATEDDSKAVTKAKKASPKKLSYKLTPYTLKNDPSILKKKK